VNPVPLGLLPDNATVQADGSLAIGGCDLAELAAQYGTPLFVYDEAHLRARCAEAVAAFGPGRAYYATKAFLCTQWRGWYEGMHLTLPAAANCRAPAPACRPTPCVPRQQQELAELRMAITEGVRHIVVDSFDELDRLTLHRACRRRRCWPHHTGCTHPRVHRHRPGRQQVRLQPG
jgi:diaminopimelate decarboxylase